MTETVIKENQQASIPLGKIFLTTASGFTPGTDSLSVIVNCKNNSYRFQAAFVAQNASRDQLWMHYEGGDVLLFPLYQPPSERSNENMSRLNLSPHATGLLSQALYLPFAAQESSSETNTSPVCFATAPEVRDDYKVDVYPQSFGPMDYFDYIYAYLHCRPFIKKYQDTFSGELPAIPIPKSQIRFWDIVRIGSGLRQAHLGTNEQETSTPILHGKGTNRVDYFRVADEEMDVPSGFVYIRINKSQHLQIPRAVWGYEAGNLFLFRRALMHYKDVVLKEMHLQQIGAYTLAIQYTIEAESALAALCK